MVTRNVGQTAHGGKRSFPERIRELVQGGSDLFDLTTTLEARLPGLHLQVASGLVQRHDCGLAPDVLPRHLLDSTGLSEVRLNGESDSEQV